MTPLLDAAGALVTLLQGLPSWPDALDLESVRRRKVGKNEVDVAIWRERRERSQEMLGAGPGASLYRHTATLQVAIRITGDEASARTRIDTMLAEAGIAIDADRSLGGRVSDLEATETTFDWDDGGGAGQAFHEAVFGLVFDYDSPNPLI
jgi:hypothetical protein